MSSPSKKTIGESMLILPEDAFKFSPDIWQNKFGCNDNNIQYVGYSGDLAADLSILNISGKDKLYQLGDLVTNDQGNNYRIIWIDNTRTILSDGNEVIVKCKVGSKKEASKTLKTKTGDSDILTKANEINKIESSLGNITKIDGSEGHGGGYKLTECYKYCWLLKRLNIEIGDVIKSIDGVNILSFNEEKLKNYISNKRTDIKVTIDRNGKEEVININYNTIWPIVRLMH